MAVVERKFFKNNHLKAGISARGGLEPAFRVLFSAVFHGFPWGISIRVAICGKDGNQNCSFCSRSTYKVFMCFDHRLPFHADLKDLSITRF